MASQLKRKRTDVKSDGPQVAMHSQLPRFLVSVFFTVAWLSAAVKKPTIKHTLEVQS